jgi:PAS domain S-box-containing protein
MITAVAASLPTNDVDVNLTGKARMDAMRRALDSIVRMAEQRRIDRIERWQTQVRHAIYALILVATGVGLFIALLTRNRLEAVSLAFQRSLDLQRSRAEQLFRSEQHFRTTLASIGDAVITCDKDGVVQTMNPVAQELTGWTEAEACNRALDSIFRIVNETTKEPVESPVSKVKRLNRIVGLANHTLLLRKDGSELAIDDSGAPIRNEAGELTGVVMVFRDITMERRTRAALIANEKLAVAGRLAATIAHEIHNPLDSVSNILYLLQGGTTPEESKHFLDIAQSELERVTQISRAMLSLYRESKAPVPINLKDTLEDLLVLMERRMHELGVKVIAELPEDIEIEGFPAELRQVFTNLINNAAEAAGDGGSVCVRLTAKPQGMQEPTARDGKPPRPGALVEICDTGMGIPLDVREHLFQPFFTTKGERGTGLGLWVCQGIIRKHGGALDLHSELEGPNRGTVASVFLAAKPEIDPGAV